MRRPLRIIQDCGRDGQPCRARVSRSSGCRTILHLFDGPVADLAVDNDVEIHRSRCQQARRLASRLSNRGVRTRRVMKTLSGGEDCRDLGLWEHLRMKHDAKRVAPQLSNQSLPTSNWRSQGCRGTGTGQAERVVGQQAGGTQEVGQALLAGDARPTRLIAAGRVDTVPQPARERTAHRTIHSGACPCSGQPPWITCTRARDQQTVLYKYHRACRWRQ